ncbi:MAG: cupin domain-containing protein [Nitrospirae bacterium]|nr:cupin domain-containing protein [Nitrospirota bacterium]MBF0535838.1 cupin domain-containing protein [Nitrospirota bacterium]MBF0617697.1 cupin domain-containing protein [Nitrospirota bacterium]
MLKKIEITYRVKCYHGEDVQRLVRKIALEQTVEVPEELAAIRGIGDTIIGKTESITPLDENLYLATISYNPEITAYQLPQFLNVLYGNISLLNGIKIVDIKLPECFIEKFRGPNFGIEGIRKLLGVYGRPLLSTALKPMGLSPAELAEIAYNFAHGGGDLIKDDHGLVDRSFDKFKQRISLCTRAVTKANFETGKNTIYFPNICAQADMLERCVSFAADEGIRGILISPFLVGIDSVRYLSEKFNMIVMSHPALTGTHFHDLNHGISIDVLLGTIFRLAGADISIYPNTGGRFGFTQSDCKKLHDALRHPLYHIKPSFPAPAGGMSFDSITDMAALYGSDTVYLIGGALHLYNKSLRKGTADFLIKIREIFDEKTTPPDLSSNSAHSSCDMTANTQGELLCHLPFNSFLWHGRIPTVYKASEHQDFKDIIRHELTGQYGEQTNFDLRYFEIAEKGYSSLEKHQHEHVIICVRGVGQLISGEDKITLNPLDVAYVPPMQVHRLINETAEPFGFFCIVDHIRDKPQKP